MFWDILGARESAKIAQESYLGLLWGCFGAIKSSRYVQDSTMITPRSPYHPDLWGGRALLGLSWWSLVIFGFLGLSWRYPRSLLRCRDCLRSILIDPEMVEKVWFFSSETDVVPSSCLLSCALLSCVILMLSWQWRAIKLMSLARNKIFKHVMFGSLGAVLELSTPKIGLR